MNLNDLEVFLPKFLSSESTQELFKSLKNFPDNIDSRFYTNYLSETKVIYQGDGIRDMIFFNFEKMDSKHAPGLIFSNTCDIDIINKRNFPSRIVYAPIFNLEKYQDSLFENSQKNRKQIETHKNTIKEQKITQIFYLPEHKPNIEDSIVFLDRVFNCSNDYIKRQNLKKLRLFTLSDYGEYLFLLKLSIHFTRIQDQVERKSLTI